MKSMLAKDGLPAFLISDGTVNIIALIIALYFQQKPGSHYRRTRKECPSLLNLKGDGHVQGCIEK